MDGQVCFALESRTLPSSGVKLHDGRGAHGDATLQLPSATRAWLESQAGGFDAAVERIEAELEIDGATVDLARRHGDGTRGGFLSLVLMGAHLNALIAEIVEVEQPGLLEGQRLKRRMLALTDARHCDGYRAAAGAIRVAERFLRVARSRRDGTVRAMPDR